MLPANFPQRKQERRISALKRRSLELDNWLLSASFYHETDDAAGLEKCERKITAAETDINNLSYKLGLPLIHETKHFAQDGKRNRRNK